MYASGVALPAIRAAIEGKYRPAYRTMTPTPPIKTEASGMERRAPSAK